MSKTQKNKATSGHLGLLKAKLAKLKREVLYSNLAIRAWRVHRPQLISDAAGGKGGGGGGDGFDVNKSGDARVGLVGEPTCSRLHHHLTTDCRVSVGWKVDSPERAHELLL